MKNQINAYSVWQRCGRLFYLILRLDAMGVMVRKTLSHLWYLNEFEYYWQFQCLLNRNYIINTILYFSCHLPLAPINNILITLFPKYITYTNVYLKKILNNKNQKTEKTKTPKTTKTKTLKQKKQTNEKEQFSACVDGIHLFALFAVHSLVIRTIELL